MSITEAGATEVARVKPRGQAGRRTHPWIVADPTIPGMLAQLPDAEVIPLPVVRDIVGWDKAAQKNAVKQGVIRPVEKRGPAGCYQVTRDDAVTILVAAALAFAAGVAIVAMIRAVQGSGLDARILAEAAT